MSVHEDRGAWIVRWRDNDTQRSRRFGTQGEAEAHDAVMHGKAWPATEAPVPTEHEPGEEEPIPAPDESGMVDTAVALSSREQVSLKTAKRWLDEGFVRWDEPVYQCSDGQLVGEIYKAERTLEADLAHVVCGRTPIPAERARQKALRERREATAVKHRVAIGMVRFDGTLIPGAKRLDGTPVEEAQKA